MEEEPSYLEEERNYPPFEEKNVSRYTMVYVFSGIYFSIISLLLLVIGYVNWEKHCSDFYLAFIIFLGLCQGIASIYMFSKAFRQIYYETHMSPHERFMWNYTGLFTISMNIAAITGLNISFIFLIDSCNRGIMVVGIVSTMIEFLFVVSVICFKFIFPRIF